jgi:hypothetical protein
MKTLIILFTILFTCLTYSQDSTFVKNLDKQIAEKDTLIGNMQNAFIQEAYDKNFFIVVGNKKIYFRDEIIKKQELEKLRELYLKEEKD